MKKKLNLNKNLCLIFPVIVILFMGISFSMNLQGILFMGIWNLNTVQFFSSGVVNIKMKTEEIILLEPSDQVDLSSNEASNRFSYQINPPEYISGTVTIPPVPTYTLEFPRVTETSQLLQANRSPENSEISKKESAPFWFSLWRFWPIVLLMVIWFVIGIWYIFSQLIID